MTIILGIAISMLMPLIIMPVLIFKLAKFGDRKRE